MPFIRTMVQDGALSRYARAGDYSVANPVLTINAVDANDTMTAAEISTGIMQYTAFTAGRTLTTDTAVNILAANPAMDVSDSLMCKVSIVPAFAGTFVAGTGVTLAGRATCPAASSVDVLITKTSATTVTWTVL
jgi:hypothetical protein